MFGGVCLSVCVRMCCACMCIYVYLYMYMHRWLLLYIGGPLQGVRVPLKGFHVLSWGDTRQV